MIKPYLYSYLKKQVAQPNGLVIVGAQCTRIKVKYKSINVD